MDQDNSPSNRKKIEDIQKRVENIQEGYNAKLRNIILTVAFILGSGFWIVVFFAFFGTTVQILKIGVWLAGLTIIAKLLFII
jgi:hypothetical protein